MLDLTLHTINWPKCCIRMKERGGERIRRGREGREGRREEGTEREIIIKAVEIGT